MRATPLAALLAGFVTSAPVLAAPGGHTKPAGIQTGIFVYLADAGLFTRCSDGHRLPVAQAGANLALERAYAAHRSQPAAPLAVRLAGHLETRPGPDGGNIEMLVVDHFGRALPGQGCPNTADLPTTRWALESLPGSGVTLPDGPHTPSIQFDAERRRITGSTGCNRMNGEYRSWSGTGLSILPLATTRMVCPAKAVESAFLQALARATHRIQAADRLDLLADGVPVARFVARQAPRPASN